MRPPAGRAFRIRVRGPGSALAAPVAGTLNDVAAVTSITGHLRRRVDGEGRQMAEVLARRVINARSNEM